MEKMNLRAEVTTKEQLEQALMCPQLQFIYAPVSLLNEAIADKSRIIAVPPVFLGDCEDETREKLSELSKAGFTRVLAHTVAHVEMITSLGMTVHGGFRLNIANSVAQKFFEEKGLADTTLSIELDVKSASTLKHSAPIGAIAYGRLPLMITRRCPVNNGKPCMKGHQCGKEITDRRGNKMSLICSNTVEILNPDTLILSDKIRDFRFLDFLTLRFTVETDLDEVVAMYLTDGKPDGNLTRGLYYRGVE